MDRDGVLSRMKEAGIVAIVRAQGREQVFKIVESCLAGGVKVIELSFTMPEALAMLREMAERYRGAGILPGAGTVLDPETARAAIAAGAQYIISPYLNTETVKLCQRYQIACIPGAMSIKEVAEAMEAGADIVKVFPSELFGPAIIKAIKGPLPYAPLMPTGGVTVDNVGEWFAAGAVAVGVGNGLTAGATPGDYESITRKARAFVEKISTIKNGNLKFI